MSTTRFIFLAMAVMIIASLSHADDVWQCYPNGNWIYDVAFQGNYVWCATDGSLVRWNTLDKTYRQFTTEDGLAHNRVRSVFVDSHNKLWIGSNGGVQCYDGTSFTTYTPENSGLVNIYVLAIAEADDGAMWFGTFGGISRFDGETWTSYTTENSSLVGDFVVELEIDKSGVLWLVPYKDRNYVGIMSFDGETWTHYTVENSGLASKYVQSIAVDENNVKWIGTEIDLQSFDGTTWTNYNYPRITGIAIAPDGAVVVATMPGTSGIIYPGETYTIARWDGSTWTELPVNDMLSVPIYGYEQVYVDNEGTPWFVSRNNGFDSFSLFHYDGSELTQYVTDGPGSYYFNDVYVDKDNVKWFATSYGASKYDGNAWENLLFTIPEEYDLTESQFSRYWILTNYVGTIFEDHDGILWFACNSCIRSFDSSSWKFYDRTGDEALKHLSTIWDACVDRNNVKWFLTPGSLISFDGTNWIKNTYLQDQKLSPQYMTADADNVKWLLVPMGSIWSFDGTNWTEFSKENTGLEGVNLCCAVDHNNVKWFGTSKSLFSYDGSSWKSYEQNTAGCVEDIVVDENNTLWLISGGRLQSFDGSTWITYDIEISGITRELAIDQDGFIWFGSSGGTAVGELVSFNKNALPSAVESRGILPSALKIRSNYPNPFNPSTTIEFSLPESGFAELVIYNIMGQKIRELVSESMTSGVHSVAWDGRNDSGSAVSSGLYISTLKMGDTVATKRMMLLK